MIIYTTATTAIELEQILVLQQKNLPTSVSAQEKEKEGFVTVVHNFEILKAMNDVCPHIIAKSGEQVVAYALCMHPKFANEIEVLKPMFKELDCTVPLITNCIAMGQICVDKAFRRQGIFRKLYETMQAKTQKSFNCIITEIDATNARSIQAHYAVGFKELKTYDAADQEWKIVFL
ncbi:GNAT family N-acetyltransferase [Zobellia alginiliquefaciens]|uniref:GNAT family N-acetyltransferase n=1 Tax=Zobellia alginiliquefaciens TaxID=3032586 RepID=UPI0023E3637D|nr:GNAT family N-acetyltransferase [Zobellia alginiliquefaciens]